MKNRYRFKAYLAWATICIVWGTTYLAIRIGVKDFPPFLFAGFRWIIAGSLLVVIMKSRGYKLPPRSELFHLAIVGIALLGVANGFVVVAEQWIPSGLTALFITTVPLIVAIIELLFIKERKFNRYLLGGLILGFIGVLLILGSNLADLFNSSYYLGFAFLLIAVLSWAGGSVYSKYKKLKTHVIMGASIQMLIAGVLQVLVGIILGEHFSIHLTANGIYSLLYLAIVGSILGYGSYMYAISHLPVSFVATYAYVNPVIALFVGWLFLNEKINFLIISAALIILIAVWMVNKGNRIVKSKIEHRQRS